MVQWNTRYNVVKLAPLVRWTETDVWEYIHEHGLPYNELMIAVIQALLLAVRSQ